MAHRSVETHAGAVGQLTRESRKAAGDKEGRPGPHRASPVPFPGLAVDYHNERLYWADAKLSVIGSIRLNGTDPIVAADSKRGQGPQWGVTDG